MIVGGWAPPYAWRAIKQIWLESCASALTLILALQGWKNQRPDFTGAARVRDCSYSLLESDGPGDQGFDPDFSSRDKLGRAGVGKRVQK